MTNTSPYASTLDWYGGMHAFSNSLESAATNQTNMVATPYVGVPNLGPLLPNSANVMAMAMAMAMLAPLSGFHASIGGNETHSGKSIESISVQLDVFRIDEKTSHITFAENPSTQVETAVKLWPKRVRGLKLIWDGTIKDESVCDWVQYPTGCGTKERMNHIFIGSSDLGKATSLR